MKFINVLNLMKRERKNCWWKENVTNFNPSIVW